MHITYKYDDNISAEEIFELLYRMTEFDGDRFPAKNVFHINLRSIKKETIALRNSLSVTARSEDGLLIGYLRVITEGVYIYYVLDVMVDPVYRGQGVGSELVRLAITECKEGGFIKLFLTAIPGAEGFYEKYGFKEGMSPVLTMRGEDYK